MPGTRRDGYLELVFSRLATGSDPATTPLPMLRIIRILVLLGVIATLPFATPRLALGGHGLAIAITLGVCAVLWIAWMLTESSPRMAMLMLALLAVPAGVIAGLDPLSTAVAVGCTVTSSAGSRLNPEISLAITAETIAAFLIAGLLTGAPTESLVGYPLLFFGLWGVGLTWHSFLTRAEQAERTLAEARRAREAETHAAALAERARIAREIHDVLAHSLAAVSVNLQAAEGLLGGLPSESLELTKAIECIGRAATFTREGLADARRAIVALRDDTPLTEQLTALAERCRADNDTTVDFTVTGTPRPISPEVGLAAYRTAQEALTNARKHAPGRPIGITLEFDATELSLRIVNRLGENGPLSATGAGYGLKGLGERASQSGGTLTTGPVDGEWRVCLRIPV
jgi:signal transduction histidine kinase